jgi:hypothetical protein
MTHRRLIVAALIVGSLSVTAILILKIVMRPVLQSVDSPGSRHTARLFRLYDEGGPAPYGSEVSLSAASNPVGRFGGVSMWIGYCEGGRLSWKSNSDLELACPSHPDARDVYVIANHDGIKFRVIRLR